MIPGTMVLPDAFVAEINTSKRLVLAGPPYLFITDLNSEILNDMWLSLYDFS